VTTTDLGGGFVANTTTGVVTVVEAGYYLLESIITSSFTGTPSTGQHFFVNAVTNAQIGKRSLIPSVVAVNGLSQGYVHSLTELTAGTQIKVRFGTGTTNAVLASDRMNSMTIRRVG